MCLADLAPFYQAVGATTLYTIGLFGYLYEYLPAPLVLPGFVYASAIATMAITSICSPLQPSSKAGNLAATWSKLSGVVGALIFVVSDSVLAVNKARQTRTVERGAAAANSVEPTLLTSPAPLAQFAFPLPGGKDIVMATYYAGQIGITLSAWGAKEVVRDVPVPMPAGVAKEKRAKKAD